MGEISSYCVCVCDVGLLFKQLQYKVRDLFGNYAVIRKSKARLTKTLVSRSWPVEKRAGLQQYESFSLRTDSIQLSHSTLTRRQNDCA